jgi:dihydrofolate reductase
METFISVVSETWIFEDMMFFSEKTWKPIMLGHPFILIGNPGSLAELKSMGYKTFDTWINEKYDENLPLMHRYNIILSELKKFSEKSKDELIFIRNEMRDICIHNKKVFFNNYDKNGSEMVRLYGILQRIINE